VFAAAVGEQTFLDRNVRFHFEYVMRLTAAWTSVLAVLAMSAVGAWAAKPGGGGGGPVPPGAIYFNYGGAPMQMLADGSGKQSAPFELGQASRGTYGSAATRWFLSTGDDYHLWATKDGISQMQITNMLETDNGDGTKTGMHLVGWPSWSNDGADSFVSVAAFHWVQPNSEPVPPTV
jgi:hypothetical protein